MWTRQLTRFAQWLGQGCALFFLVEVAVHGQALELVPRLVHLRNAGQREWSSFPETPEAATFETRFQARQNVVEHTLRLRQQDVKQLWRLRINGKTLGELVRDENDMVSYFAIPPGVLVDGENVFQIECSAPVADDIRVGEIVLADRARVQVLDQAHIEIQVVDAVDRGALPARITIVDANGSLQTMSAISGDHLAVRPGVIYTATGQARLGVPAGSYQIYAGRGFEYSLAKIAVNLKAGEEGKHTLTIRREVSTPGYVACDTHVHTVTYSGHGDATIDERMITLAGEGIELPIATDHNVHIDYEEPAKRLMVRQYFTPVTGNEVTTAVGHFNIFPVRAEAKPPDHRPRDWKTVFDNIFGLPGVKVAILNHARDLHSGVRPFGPDHFNWAIGENLVGWPMRFNGMELVNSGAVQTDPLRLARDWMAVLNRGYQVTPVGSSDSHDVARHFVGQGRTYIRCDDTDVGNIDVQPALASFLAGRVTVSYGLLTELIVDDKYLPGELATFTDAVVDVGIRVLGPHWVSASRVQLYVNGQLHREEAVQTVDRTGSPPGEIWKGRWRLARPKHDVHLVAIAVGPGIEGAYWPTAKPYQPTSPDWQSSVLGVSGAVWIDGDGDGRRSAARDYGERAMTESGGDLAKLVEILSRYDAAVAAQAAHAFRLGGGSFTGAKYTEAIQTAAPAVQNGFRMYQEAMREHERTRAGQR